MNRKKERKKENVIPQKTINRYDRKRLLIKPRETLINEPWHKLERKLEKKIMES